MSDDEADPELLELLRQSLGLGAGSSTAPPNTKVLESAEYVYDNSIDVAISSSATKAAAELIWQSMQQKGYSTQNWSEHELHPKLKDESTVNFIFTMNLLNFCFWSELPQGQRFAVEYKGRFWTGYWSLVAALQRALDEGYQITTPDFWQDCDACPDSTLTHIFRSTTSEPMPLLQQRIAILREAGQVLYENFGCKPANIISRANNSAAALVNLLVEYFPSFRDEAVFQGKKVRFYKRAQILVADLWACFNGNSYGAFEDIEHLTMFADYRVPQMLQSLGCLWYSPRLESRVKRLVEIQSGEDCEVEVRGCSIWCVELIRRQIIQSHSEAQGRINAVLIDFYLYDTCKEMERDAKEWDEILPHHRTRSIWY